MSLYYETAAILENKNRVGGSLKSRVYGNKDLRSSLISIYALASKATQWADVLKDVIERSGLLSLERKVRKIEFEKLSSNVVFQSRSLFSFLFLFHNWDIEKISTPISTSEEYSWP